jgi:hypothetical protein
MHALARLASHCLWLGAVTSSTTACAPEPLTASQVHTQTGPPLLADEDSVTAWQNCYESFSPTGDPRADLSRLTEYCGSLGGMHPITEVHLAAQSDRDPVDRYTFYVPKPGKCYRVFAASDSTVEDLDLLLRDPRGTDIVADLTHDSWPVLPPKEPACFQSEGLYMLEVSVYRGSGRYALQIWGR